MAVFSLQNARVLAGVADLSSYVNDITVTADTKALDSTTFGSSGWMENLGGLRSSKVDLKGFFDAGNPNSGSPIADPSKPDDRLWADLGASSVVLSMIAEGYTDTNVAYLGSFMPPTYKPGGKVGDILAFDSSHIGDAPLVRGQLANSTTRTSTGTGTALNLGARTASQRVYASLHVLTVAGTGTPTLTVSVQSGSTSAFPSPTTEATFTAATAATSQIVKGTIGASSNAYYRLSWTISGTSPSFLFYGVIGIG